MSGSSVTRAFEVLNAVAARSGGATFSGLGRACPGIASATLPRLLKSLVTAGLLRKDGVGGRYVLGEGSLGFARRALGCVSRADLLQPLIDELAEQTCESAAYYELDGDALVLLVKTEKPNSFHYIPVQARTGRLDKHYFSVVILAHGPDRLLRDTLRVAGVDSGNTRKAFDRLVARARRTGCLTGPEDADQPISRAVSPVHGAAGGVVGSIGVTMIGTRLPKSRLAELAAQVQTCARRATRLFVESGVGAGEKSEV